MTPGEPAVWTRDAAALLVQFFETPTGKNFLAQIAAQRPSLSISEDNVNAVALQAKYVAGYESAFNKMLSLTEPPRDEVEVNETYPPLDDDSKWTKPETT